MFRSLCEAPIPNIEDFVAVSDCLELGAEINPFVQRASMLRLTVGRHIIYTWRFPSSARVVVA